ncbi:hypothetical protein ACKWTF_000692 [Chironomus riparius]
MTYCLNQFHIPSTFSFHPNQAQSSHGMKMQSQAPPITNKKRGKYETDKNRKSYMKLKMISLRRGEKKKKNSCRGCSFVWIYVSIFYSFPFLSSFRPHLCSRYSLFILSSAVFTISR